MSKAQNGADEPITIKKYANRRLYNTATSSYVTLDHLCQMVKDGQDFTVFDAKSGEDITRSVLTQIIFEQEGKDGQNLLPIQFLRKLIGFYDGQMQHMVPNYLNLSMDAFTKNQDLFRERMGNAFGPSGESVRLFEDMTRQNIELFQSTWTDAMSRMMGFPSNGPTASTAPEMDDDTNIDALKAQMAAMQEQLEELKRKGD